MFHVVHIRDYDDDLARVGHGPTGPRGEKSYNGAGGVTEGTTTTTHGTTPEAAPTLAV